MTESFTERHNFERKFKQVDAEILAERTYIAIKEVNYPQKDCF